MNRIRIEDLSIGDWVQDANGKYAQILGIENWSDGYVLNVRINGVNVGCVPASSAHPIPITPEILEKNGFELTNKPIVKDIRPPMLVSAHYVYRLTTDNALIDVDSVKVYIDVRGDYRSFAINCVQHIHELQRALRLAKAGKDIEL